MQRLELSSEDGGVLASAAEVLLAGGVAIFPTDTVYGMGALPRYSEALKRIYEMKDRPLGMPLPLLLSDISQVGTVSSFDSESLRTLATAFWPGPLTLVLPDAVEASNNFVAQDGTIAVRSPDHGFIQSLCKVVGPIAATSANLHGEPTPLRISGMPKAFEAVDLMIDGGECAYGSASTILDLSKERVEVLREGPITKDSILSVL